MAASQLLREQLGALHKALQEAKVEVSQLEAEEEAAERELLHCYLAQARRELPRQRTRIFFKRSLGEVLSEEAGGAEGCELGY